MEKPNRDIIFSVMKEVTLRNKKKKKFMEQLLKKEEGRKKQKKSVSFCHQRVDGTTHTRATVHFAIGFKCSRIIFSMMKEVTVRKTKKSK